MSKTPYELRVDLLAMSKEYLEQQYQRNFEFARTAFEKSVEVGQATLEEWQKYAPPFYDFTDVIKKAEELYSFVSTKEVSK